MSTDYGVATNYDAPLPEVRELQEQSLDLLQSTNAPSALSAIWDVEEAEEPDADPADGELITEELVVQVVPVGEDEFTCASCFLVHHRSQIARMDGGRFYCVDCES